jgi:hypothetical protein
MGFLDGLFGKAQFDPQAYDGATGSGWHEPIAGGRAPIDQAQRPPGSAPISALSGSTPPVPMADDGIGRQADQQNPLGPLFGGIGSSLNAGLAGLFGHGGPAGMAQAPSLLDRLTAGATNLTTGGNPLAGIVNAVSGLATGQRTDAAGVTQAQQAALRQALAAAGVPDALASAAALSPEVLKTIAPRFSAVPRPGGAGRCERGRANDVRQSGPNGDRRRRRARRDGRRGAGEIAAIVRARSPGPGRPRTCRQAVWKTARGHPRGRRGGTATQRIGQGIDPMTDLSSLFEPELLDVLRQLRTVSRSLSRGPVLFGRQE